MIGQTISRLHSIRLPVKSIYLVEAGPSLREVQRRNLCLDQPLDDTAIGFEGISRHIDRPIVWVEDLKLVPRGLFPFYFYYIYTYISQADMIRVRSRSFYHRT